MSVRAAMVIPKKDTVPVELASIDQDPEKSSDRDVVCGCTGGLVTSQGAKGRCVRPGGWVGV